MLPNRFTPPLVFRLVYSAMVLPLGFGGLDAFVDGDFSLLRRFGGLVFTLFVLWLVISIWTASVLVHQETLEVRRLFPGRHHHRWSTIKECRHGAVLSFIVLRDGRWIALGWFSNPGQMQLAMEAAQHPASAHDLDDDR